MLDEEGPYVKAPLTPHEHVIHGSQSTYNNYGCRGPKCREAVRIAQLEYRTRKKKEERTKVMCSCGHDRKQHSRNGCTWEDQDKNGKWVACKCKKTYNDLR